MSKFQIIFIAIFALFIVAGVMFFATFKGKSEQTLPAITIWGTISEEVFNGFLSEYSLTLDRSLTISYVEKNETTFNQEYIEALASDRGPDAILVPHELILKEEDKLLPIPYEIISERAFKNTFIQSAELYLTSEGVLALPLSIDPLVMYWNRDIFTNAGLATYPRYWGDFSVLAERITKKDGAANITQSAVALGEFRNVPHAKEILATLILQTGDPIVMRTANGPMVTFQNSAEGSRSVQSAVQFFTEFSNPVKPTYSWNRALPNSKNHFIAGDLATYFGFSSELGDIRNKNPNLNFDVAPLPQVRDADNRVTFGKIHAFGIAKSTMDANGTYEVLSMLTSPEALTIWSDVTGLPPVRRDLLSTSPKDPYLEVYYDAALTSRAWMDPDPVATNTIFQNMVESVVSSRETLYDAVNRAGRALQDLYN